MKLRCTHNSIRLRLRKSEVQLLAEGPVVESIRLSPGQQWRFSLAVDPEVTECKVHLMDSHLAVKIPKPMAEQWINSNEVSIEKQLDIVAGESLHLLIEKDFPCTGRPGEDPSDFFGELADSGEAC